MTDTAIFLNTSHKLFSDNKKITQPPGVKVIRINAHRADDGDVLWLILISYCYSYQCAYKMETGMKNDSTSPKILGERSSDQLFLHEISFDWHGFIAPIVDCAVD